MPGYSNKRTRDMANKNWGGRQNQRRDDRRGNLQSRIGGARPMVNPWENGVTPGMQSGLLSQTFAAQPMGSSYLLSSGMNRGMSSGYGYNTNKMRRLDRMGGFDDERGRGLLPPPNAPLLGVAPPAFPPPARGPDYLHQRMGNPWESSFHSGGLRSMSSLYYPSNRGRQDNRKFVKAKRVNNKSSSSSSSTSKGNSSSKEGKGGRAKGGTTPNKSPSTREREDKDKDSSHSKDAKNKQGDNTPEKSERSADKEEEEEEEHEEGKDEIEIVEEVVKEDGKEGDDKKDDKEEKTDKDKPQEEPFPVKALYCHICELDSFSSKKGYIRHLQGITHAKMAEMFHAKNAATLELLNISAKLVQKWLKVGSCCGTKYKSPFGLEEHKLSIHHLKAKYQQKKDKDDKEAPEEAKAKDADDEDSVTKESEDTFVEDSHDDIVRISEMLEKALKEAEENPLTMQNLPVYDPSTMIGLEFIKREIRFRCKLCKGQMFKSLETHCQSHSHYDNIASHLNKVEDMKREEQRKKEEAEAEEKKKKEKEEKEKAEEAKKAEIKKDAEDDDDNQAEFVTIDDTKMKSEDEQDDMDEDVIPLGEEEERILNEKSEVKKEMKQEEEEEEEEEEELMEENIFEEVGEKIDFGEDLKKQLENGKEGQQKKKKQQQQQPAKREEVRVQEDEDDEEEEEEVIVEPPPKKVAYAPRRRGRARGRGRWAK